jgi:hypothetical protein
MPFNRSTFLLAPAIILLATPASWSGDIDRVEDFLETVSDSDGLTLCLEPHYPPGDCSAARFTEGVRYNWVHAVDVRSNERISLIHDTQRNGSSPVFHSTIPGYGPMRFAEPPDDIWCMPEYRIDATPRYHARIAGFSERGANPSGQALARYGLYLVSETQERCETLLRLGRDLLH